MPLLKTKDTPYTVSFPSILHNGKLVKRYFRTRTEAQLYANRIELRRQQQIVWLLQPITVTP